jgi:hypothetical protein
MAAKQADTPSGPKVPAPPVAGVDLTSVAGEEDPGASIDLPAKGEGEGGRAVPPADRPREATGAQAPMAPGDQAPAGTPSTGERPCPQCGGTGRLGASACPHCQGTGVVIVGIGGA